MREINITICDEFFDNIQHATAQLDLDSGLISNLERDENSIDNPKAQKDWDFSSGMIKFGQKELEFTVKLENNNKYYVSPMELKEINEKLSQFAKPKSKFRT